MTSGPVTITSVRVLDNPAKFADAFRFEISCFASQPLDDDLEWKLIYVGSAEDEARDQLLENVAVGPICRGTNQFVFQAPAPDHTRIPTGDLLGVTVILLTCSYRGQEFTRIGYYVNNSYSNPELCLAPPLQPRINEIERNILADKPRVTLFNIDWTPPGSVPPSATAQTDAQFAPAPQPQPTPMEVSPPYSMDATLSQGPDREKK